MKGLVLCSSITNSCLCGTSIRSVLGQAEYGDYLFVYQGTTIGGSSRYHKEKRYLEYPVLGDFVLMYFNSFIFRKCKIGNCVVVYSGTCILNQDIPDNCAVFGQSSSLIIKQKSLKQIN